MRHFSFKSACAAVGTIALTAGAGVALLASPGAAGADTGQSISGSIQGADGSAATNVCAVLYTAADNYDAVQVACSDATGHYSLSNVATGQYILEFVDGDTSRHDVPQYYNGKADTSSATILTVQSGTNADNINATMQPGAYLLGTVKDASTGDPITDTCVEIYDSSTGGLSGGVADASAKYVSFDACTNSQGQFVTGAFNPTGSYKVSVNGEEQDKNYIPYWVGGGSDYSTASANMYSSGPNTVNAALQPGVVISGMVTDSSTSAPIENVNVTASNASDQSYISQADTDSDGRYSITVPTGSVILGYTDYTDNYIPEFYENQYNENNATTINVTNGEPISNINQSLTVGGTISGNVRNSTGPVAGITAVACSSADSAFSDCESAITDAEGDYTINSLAGGSYTVSFSGNSSFTYYDESSGSYVTTSTSQYVNQVYPNQVATSNAEGTPVSVTRGQNTPGIDDTLVRGSTYSGTVTDAATGTPIAGICVDLSPSADSASAYYGSQGVCTSSDGTFTTAGVPAGSYLMQFQNYSGRYVASYWKNALSQSDATSIVATSSPADYSGYDQQMILGGQIAGSITDSAGHALDNVCAEIYTSAATPAFVSETCTDSSGNYTSNPLEAGNYYVEFVDDSGQYASSYYKNASSFSGATQVSVTAGQTTSGIDGQLAAATVPGKPTAVTATAGDASATVNFTAPSSDGGSPITGYTVTPSPACTSCTGTTTDSTSATINGLTNGTAYTFTVTATNAVGNGSASDASNSVTPEASTGGTPTKPGAPTNISAVANVSKVNVGWSAPASDGGSDITGYTVTPSPACASCTGLTTDGTTTSTTVSGLTTGTRYTFTVTATNAQGTSPSSVSSPAAVPVAAAQSPVSKSTSDASEPATVTNNGTTATTSGGTGTVTVSQYPSNPAATPTFDPSGAYLDVSTSSGSTFTSVNVKDCNLNGGNALEWWDPSAADGGQWEPVVGDPTDTSGLPGCLSVTLDGKSSPTVSELGGTIFGVAVNGGTTGGGGGGGGAGGGGAGGGTTGGTGGSGTGTGSGSSSGGCTMAPFRDVTPKNPFCGDITWLAQQHIATGYSNGTFGPNQSVSRQAMAAFLYRFAHPGETPAKCTSDPYPDVHASNSLCGYVQWLKGQHITDAYSDGGFHPDAPVSREAMAAFIYRLVNTSSNAKCTKQTFTDVSTANPFCGDIEWLVTKKVATGYGNSFHPDAAISRQAMAAFLHRLYIVLH